MNKKNNIYMLLLFVTTILCINFLYVFHYYNNITLINIATNLVVCFNYIGYYIEKLINVLLEKEILKILVIGILIIYGINKFKFVEILKGITSFELKDFKIKREVISDKLEQNVVPKEIDTKLEQSSLSKEIDHESKSYKEIERLFIDCPFMASIVDGYLNSNMRNITINLNLIPYKIKLQQIDIIFEYKIKGNSIILISIKKELESIVIDVFMSLKERGILYLE